MNTEKKEQARLFSNSDLRKLILPLILEQTLVITVGMVDTMMVSSVGEAAVSGVSLVDMLVNLVLSVFAALSTGGAVVTSFVTAAALYGGDLFFTGDGGVYAGLPSDPVVFLWQHRGRCHGKCQDLPSDLCGFLPVYGCVRCRSSAVSCHGKFTDRAESIVYHECCEHHR